jgi:hypothetical protein
MREFLFTAVTAATVLSGAMLDERAEAMTPAGMGAAAARAAIFQLAVNVCASNGCVPVQTKRIQHHKPGTIAAKHI